MNKTSCLLLLFILFSCKENQHKINKIYHSEFNDSMKLKADNDSLQLLYYLKKTLTYENDIDYKNLSLDEIEDIYESKSISRYVSKNSSSIYYSPDSVFKIFEIILSDQNSNPITDHYIQSNLLSQTKLTDKNFEEIQNIYKMSDDKYLIIHYGLWRIHKYKGETRYRASLISFEKDKVIYHEIPMPKMKMGTYDDQVENGELYLEQDFGVSLDSSFINYDINSKVLSYRVANKLIYNFDIDSTFIFEGHYKYRGGEFIKQKEVKTPTNDY